VKQLKGRGSPTVEEAGPFVAAILEEALKPVEVEADEFARLIPPMPDTLRKRRLRVDTLKQRWPEVRVWSWGERMARRGELKRGQEEGQEIYQKIQTVLSAELAEKKADEDKGWAPGFLKEVLTKEIPGEGLKAKLKSICAEPDAKMRGEALLQFAREELLLTHELPQTAQQIVALIPGQGPAPSEGPERALRVGRAELLVSHLAHEADLSMLGAMAVAPFLGMATESLALGGLKKWRQAARIFSYGAGLAGEAGGFALARRTFASGVADPEKLLSADAIFEETVAAGLLFGLTRLAHGGTRVFQGEMMKGRLGAWAVEGSPQFQFLTSPTGRIGLTPVHGASLTPWGQRVAALAHHTGGIGAMWAAGGINQAGDLVQQNTDGLGGSIFDAAYMYVHALIGFQFADGFTAGRLRNGITGARMRLANRMNLPEAPPPLDPDDMVGINWRGRLDEFVARNRLRWLRGRLHEIRGERDQGNQRNAMLRTELERIEEANARLVGENGGYRFRIGELEQELETTRIDLDAKTREFATAESEIRQKDEELGRLRPQLALELDRVDRLNTRIRSHEHSLDQARAEISGLTQGLDALKQQNGAATALQEFQRALLAAHEQAKEARGEYDREHDRYVKLETSAGETAEELRKAQRELRAANEALTSLRGEHAQLGTLYENAHGRAEGLAGLNETQRLNLEALQKQKDDLEKQVSTQTKRGEEAEAKARELGEKVAKLNREAESNSLLLDRTLGDLTIKLEQAEQTIKHLRSRVAVTELQGEAISLLEAQLKGMKDELKRAQAKPEVSETSADRDSQLGITTRVMPAATSAEFVRALEAEGGSTGTDAEVDDLADTGDRNAPATGAPTTGEEVDELAKTAKSKPRENEGAEPGESPELKTIQSLAQDEIDRTILAMARRAAAQPSPLPEEPNFRIFGVDIQTLQEAPPVKQDGVVVVYLSLEPGQTVLRLQAHYRELLERKLGENISNEEARRLLLAIQALDGAPLEEPSAGGPIPARPVVSVGFPSATSLSATSAAGAVSSPSAHAAPAGVTEGGAAVATALADNPDLVDGSTLRRLPQGAVPVPGAVPTADLAPADTEPALVGDSPSATVASDEGMAVGDSDVFFEPSDFEPPGLNRVEPHKVGLMSELSPIEIRMGERGPHGSPALFEIIQEVGNLAGVTDQGEGYKDQNESLLIRVIGPDGSVIMGGVDGAGGSRDGKAAAQAIAAQVTQATARDGKVSEAIQLADDHIHQTRELLGSYGTIAVVKVTPPGAPGEPFLGQPFYAGDSPIAVVRRGADGRRQPVWRSKREAMSHAMIEHNPALRGSPANKRTMLGHVGAGGNIILNGVGQPGQKVQIRGLDDGISYPGAQIVTLQDGTKALLLQVDDEVWVYDDGVDENFPSFDALLDEVQDAADAEAVVHALHSTSLVRMHVLSETRGELERQYQEIKAHAARVVQLPPPPPAGPFLAAVVPRLSFAWEGRQLWVDQWGEVRATADSEKTYLEEDSFRIPLEWQDQTIYLNYDGVAYDSQEGGERVGHFKTDNMFLTALEIAPRASSAHPPPEAKRAAPAVPPPLPRKDYITGRVWFVDPAQGLVFGRNPDNGVTLDHALLAKNHVRIYQDGRNGPYYVGDLGGRGNTRLNERVVTIGSIVPLQDGDIIHAGPYGLQVHLWPQGQAIVALPYHFKIPPPPAPAAVNLFIGSDPQNHFPVFDPAAAAQHAMIVATSSEARIQDLGGPEGTLLNGIPIGSPGQPGEFHLLKEGDFFTIGKVTLQAVAGKQGGLELKQVLNRPSALDPHIQGDNFFLRSARLVRVRGMRKPVDVYLVDRKEQSWDFNLVRVRTIERGFATIDPVTRKITNLNLERIRITNNAGKDLVLTKGQSGEFNFDDRVEFGEHGSYVLRS
jgi:pSer/pThr/pTyr-binding forkhead associated (FHA) protein/uncharacterized coiled-coil DUF342 family protein